MTQILKDHIRESIIEAALQAFAAHGFSGASVADIAARAGISTGNIYKYFKSKVELFDAVLPNSFVRLYLKKVWQRVEAYSKDLYTNTNALPQNSMYLTRSEELLKFSIDNRLRLLILYEGTQGTKYESFIIKLRSELTEKAMQNLKFDKKSNAIMKTVLDDIYANYLTTLGSILRRYCDESDIRKAIHIYSSYHLSGLANIAS